VYRARDIRLKRDVAIKVLPAAFAQDSERLARFQREAELLASLNHPNIAAVDGLEKADPSARPRQAGITAIVLELAEGSTLADRIGGGAIPIDEALSIASQIAADTLDAAHRKGNHSTHLTPANFMVTKTGEAARLALSATS
jgi:serine/threonine-protein kinase